MNKTKKVQRARRVVLPILLMPALFLPACGDDDPDESSSGGEAKAEFAGYCTTALATEAYPTPGGDFGALTPQQQQQVIKTYAAGVLQVASPLRTEAPEKIRKDVDTVLDATTRVNETGDLAPLQEKKITEASSRVHQFNLDNCGWAKTAVDGDEYSFRGLPAQLAAGPRSFEFENDGKEPHELVLLRVNDGVTDTVSQILDLPQAQIGTKVTPVGQVSAEPGKGNHLVADLTPGRYIATCFIPVGGAREGPPHFTRGMQAEIRVA